MESQCSFDNKVNGYSLRFQCLPDTIPMCRCRDYSLLPIFLDVFVSLFWGVKVGFLKCSQTLKFRGFSPGTSLH